MLAVLIDLFSLGILHASNTKEEKTPPPQFSEKDHNLTTYTRQANEQLIVTA
jgi:hypothetical protein